MFIQRKQGSMPTDIHISSKHVDINRNQNNSEVMFNDNDITSPVATDGSLKG